MVNHLTTAAIQKIGKTATPYQTVHTKHVGVLVLDGKCLAANDRDHSEMKEWIEYWIADARKHLTHNDVSYDNAS